MYSSRLSDYVLAAGVRTAILIDILLAIVLVAPFSLCTRRRRPHRHPHRHLTRHCTRRVLLANIPLLIREELR
jgi:hypothetical protein